VTTEAVFLVVSEHHKRPEYLLAIPIIGGLANVADGVNEIEVVAPGRHSEQSRPENLITGRSRTPARMSEMSWQVAFRLAWLQVRGQLSIRCSFTANTLKGNQPIKQMPHLSASNLCQLGVARRHMVSPTLFGQTLGGFDQKRNCALRSIRQHLIESQGVIGRRDVGNFGTGCRFTFIEAREA
jgi:hypothetical protein